MHKKKIKNHKFIVLKYVIAIKIKASAVDCLVKPIATTVIKYEKILK